MSPNTDPSPPLPGNAAPDPAGWQTKAEPDRVAVQAVSHQALAIAVPMQLAAARPSSLVRRLGPGLITGAADDDPSGIATYSQVGAQFGYGLAWTMLFSLPFMIVIQVISGRIGCVTGRGISENLRRHYNPWLGRAIVLLLLIANVINLGADLGAMGAALRLLLGGSDRLYTVGFGILCVVAEVFISYPAYSGALRWLTLSLFSYVAVVLTVHVPWREAVLATVVPHLALGHEAAMALVAVLGTTISPYLFFWQSAMEVVSLRRGPRMLSSIAFAS